MHLNLYPSDNTKLKALEVGAINIQLQKFKGLDVRSIDINSQVIIYNFIIIYFDSIPAPYNRRNQFFCYSS